jgi:fermentation-respiration switch protein FrsA (DUF1100 family)
MGTMSILRRRLVHVLLGVVAVLLLAYLAVGVVVANQLTMGTHRPLERAASAVQPSFEDVSFQSRVDHLTLRGWLYKAEAPSGRSAIIVHGFRQNRVNLDFNAIGLAQHLLSEHYDVLLFDLRSCGESAGQRFTLGTLEPRDLLGAYDFMRERGYPPGRMAIIGDSMGAAIVIDASPELAAVGALVADSAFARLRPLLDRDLPSNSHLPGFFDPGIYLASGMFGLDADLRPVDRVRAMPARAFLFIHGSADTFVPLANSTELRQASANPESRLLVVPGADHVKSFTANPDLYLSILDPFLDQQIREHGG